MTQVLVDAGRLSLIEKSGLHRHAGKEYSGRCHRQPKRGGAGCLISLSLERDKNSLWLLNPFAEAI